MDDQPLKSFKSSKILVTGAAGFIGSHLAERLKKQGYDVIGVDKFSDYYDVSLKRKNESDLNKLGVTILELDLAAATLTEDLPKDVNYIFHFAARPGIAATSTFEDYLSNNVLATENLTNYTKDLEALELFINIGTSSIYGKDVFCEEDTLPKPISNYGVTKLAAEQLALSKARLGYFKACSLRLYSVYGSRERPDKMFSQLIECALDNEPFPLFEGSLSHRRSFTHVFDIIDGIINTIGNESKCNGEVINLGTAEEYTTQQGVEMVEELVNTKISFDMKPPRTGDQTRTKAIITKAKHLLNYNPKVTLKQGVQEQLDWILEKRKQ
ncbi:NAD-dependent epimerase/dehydratase family protein [Aquimarina sp. ERC-38]|uniref:NAD-dependent epimerase/dehydratase family protein n=1 Tax=Aquimarina sp. ERC-38 TaxID=2949996 RepID=UPI002245CEF0|nr:NAD-dependent epimerase/dehydratase family protein [Aquimarina sp. ERC-38]UZO80247.1 NAD-dependent epimerase/dehydratase family protein [Aquimarina sp. ERC-38]